MENDAVNTLVIFVNEDMVPQRAELNGEEFPVVPRRSEEQVIREGWFPRFFDHDILIPERFMRAVRAYLQFPDGTQRTIATVGRAQED